MYQIYAKVAQYRRNDRQQDIKCGICVQETACNQENDIDYNQYQYFILAVMYRLPVRQYF